MERLPVRIFRVILISLFVFPSVAFSQVALNSTGTAFLNFSGGPSSIDMTTLTVGGAAQGCMIGFLDTGGDVHTSTTMAWDQDGTPQTMTQDDFVSNTSTLQIFSLVAPTVGTLKLHAAWTGFQNGTIGAVAFSGADQSTCIDAADNITNTANAVTTISLNITSSSNGATVGFGGNPNNMVSFGSNQILIWETNSAGGDPNVASYALGGTTNTHTFVNNGAPGNFQAVGVHILASGAPPPPATGAGLLLQQAIP